MLDKFIVAYCDNDLSVLVIEGKPTPKELQECWEGIKEQYSEAIGGNEHVARLNDVIQYALLESKLTRVNAIAAVMNSGYIGETIMNELYSLGYNIPQIKGDNIGVVLKRLEAFAKRDIMNLNILGKKIQSEQSGEGNTQDARDRFYNLISDMNICEGFKVAINERETSVALYCSYVVKFKAHIERLMNQNKKNG